MFLACSCGSSLIKEDLYRKLNVISKFIEIVVKRKQRLKKLVAVSYGATDCTAG